MRLRSRWMIRWPVWRVLRRRRPSDGGGGWVAPPGTEPALCGRGQNAGIGSLLELRRLHGHAACLDLGVQLSPPSGEVVIGLTVAPEMDDKSLARVRVRHRDQPFAALDLGCLVGNGRVGRFGRRHAGYPMHLSD